jgi:hypothetical protein
MKILMYLEDLTPGGPGHFAEDELRPWSEFLSRRFWRREFSLPLDNGRGDFFAGLIFSHVLIGEI